MAIMIFFREADTHVFSAYVFQHWWTIFVLFWLSFFSQLVLLRNVLFEVHLRYLLALFDLIYQGWWGKSAMIRLFLLVLLFCIVILCLHVMDLDLSVIMLICKWCLLIHMNNKYQYFFLWKKKHCHFQSACSTVHSIIQNFMVDSSL